MALLTVLIVSVSATAYWVWAWRLINPQPYADGWYIFRFAYTAHPVSPPYCWRPLVPMLLRWFGRWTSHAAAAATPLVLYGYLGGGWTATAIALAFVGNRHIFSYNIKHPEMSESTGHLLLVSGLWALSVGSPWALPLVALAMLCREALGLMLLVVAVVIGAWWAALAAVAAGALAYFMRPEDRDNRHPLVEDSPYETAARWVKVKADYAFDWPQFAGSSRGAIFVLPWAWWLPGDFGRLALCAYVPLWLLSVPASGVSRHLAYGFSLFAPFIAALGPEWAWSYCLLSWFWPIDYTKFKETTDGKTTFVHARG